jgi:hypothetical protein
VIPIPPLARSADALLLQGLAIRIRAAAHLYEFVAARHPRTRRAMANHAGMRTTRLYDRRAEDAEQSSASPNESEL